MTKIFDFNLRFRESFFFVILAFFILFSNNIVNGNRHPNENQLILLDDNHEDSWSRIIRNVGWGGSRWDRPNLHVLNDSTVVAGYRGNVIYIDKYHENGTLEWEFSHEVYLDLYYYDFQSFIDHENNISIFASVLDNHVLKPLFLKVDQNGNLLISKFIIELYEHEVQSIASDSHDFIYISGLNWMNFTNYLAKLDNNGDFVKLVELNGTGYPNKVYVDKLDNIFVSQSSQSLYKFSTNGLLLWKVDSCRFLNSRNPESIFAICTISDYSYFVKLNSSGAILNKTRIISDSYAYESAHSDNYTYLLYQEIDQEEKFILKYDNDCKLKWNISISEYIEPAFTPRYRISIDSNENIFIAYRSNENNVHKAVNIAILKLNGSGNFVSHIFWGADHEEMDFEMVFDSQNNLYLLTDCIYINIWNEVKVVLILVKNPLDGGSPPSINDEIDVGLIVVFTTFGVSVCISIIVCLNIIRKRYKSSLRAKE